MKEGYQKVLAFYLGLKAEVSFGLLDAQGFIHGLKAVVFSRILDISKLFKIL